MNNINNRIDFIKDHLLTNQNVSIFTGAGVSYASNLPLASNLLNYIFQSTMPEEIKQNPDFALNIDSMPFEAFIELMVGYTGNDSIFSIFNGGYQPNDNHFIAAEMLHMGHLERIYTVNFDLLYEQAFRRLSYEYKMLYRDEQFTSVNLADRKNNIVKLHGSAHDKDSMKFVLESITNKEKRSQRDNAVRYMFSREGQTVIVFGYSISDKFDITPAIENIVDKKSTVIYVNHVSEKANSFTVKKNNDYIAENHRDKGPQEYPFKDYPGYFVEDNTDTFIKTWYKLLFGNDWESPSIKHAAEKAWESALTGFISNLKNVQYKFYGSVYNRIGKYPQAVWCYEQIAKNPNHGDYAFACQQLAQIYNIMDETNKSKYYLDKATQAATEQNDSFNKIGSLFVKAEYEIKQGKYDKAILLYEECYNIAIESELSEKAIQALQGLSFVYAIQKNYQKSFEALEQAITMASQENNLWILSDLYNNKGELLHKQGKLDESLNFISKTIKLKENLKDYPNLILSVMTKGTILKNAKKFEDAEMAYNQAEDLCTKYNLSEDLPKIYYQQAVLNMTDGWLHIDRALEKLRTTIPLFEKQEKLCEEGESRILLGQLYDFMKRGMAMQIKDYLLKQSRGNDLMQPLVIDFNAIPKNLPTEEIDERFTQMETVLNGNCLESEKACKIEEFANFLKQLANEEIVKGLRLIEKIDTDYYQTIITQFGKIQ